MRPNSAHALLMSSARGLLVAAAMLALPLAPAYSHAAEAPVAGCDFDGDGIEDSAVLSRGRAVLVDESLVQGGRVKLEDRYREARCGDTDGDGADELLVGKRGRTVAFSLGKARTPALATVCRTTRSLLRGEIYKSIASRHITDQRAKSTSFITLASTRPPRNNCLNAYDRAGRLIHKLGRYFPSGALYSSRYYGGFGCGDRKTAAQVASIARSAGGPQIYLTSGTGNCALIPDANRCYNSSGC